MKKKTRRSYRNKSNLNPNSGRKPKRNKKRYLENQKEKFRKSREWKEFRVKMAIKADHKDYITGKKLVKGFNVHHMKTDQDPETYQDISNEDNFMALNSYCHKMLHYLFIFYKNDKGILERLKEVLDKMLELSPNHVDAIDQETMEECLEMDENIVNKDGCSVQDDCQKDDGKPSSTTDINNQTTKNEV